SVLEQLPQRTDEWEYQQHAQSPGQRQGREAKQKAATDQRSIEQQAERQHRPKPPRRFLRSGFCHSTVLECSPDSLDREQAFEEETEIESIKVGILRILRRAKEAMVVHVHGPVLPHVPAKPGADKDVG